ncbi:unnamed protein product [Peronospora farinosa]|uniref:Uncharacterized protein n=1 Tax=Peronospora farinosa TaxID=134698 RepID=A0AAV0UEF1_9STRA|nr:unnamed protein product [Peronospora farinosa]
MRVYVQLLLAAASITHAATAKITTSVVVNTTDYTPESSSNAARDKGDGMMNVDVLVKEDLAEAKKATIAAGSPTKPSEGLSYTAGKDDGERGELARASAKWPKS